MVIFCVTFCVTAIIEYVIYCHDMY
jgi:hypothetical protein